MKENTFRADDLFETDQKSNMLDDKLWDIVLEAIGRCIHCCPFENITYDWYDYSFELKGSTNSLSFSEEAQKKFWEIGFNQAWICHKDGDETFYNHKMIGKMPKRSKKQPIQVRIDSFERKLKWKFKRWTASLSRFITQEPLPKECQCEVTHDHQG